MKFRPYEYQKKSEEWILDHSRCALFLDMGLGKTVCTLMAIEKLIYDCLEISKVLVIAPTRVARSTWPSEIQKWDEISHLRYSVVVGTPAERTKALETDADIYIINRENVVWLTDNHQWDFDMVVIDELSSFKNNQSKRFKALKRYIGRCTRVVGLTGTPAPNGLMDLWPQIYLLDQGKRLGKTITRYRETYFRPGRSNGYVVYDYVPLEGADNMIFDKLSDMTLSMKKEDYLSIPDRKYIDHIIELDEKVMQGYKTLEKESLLKLSEDEALVANNAAGVCNKLQQIANGAIYDVNKKVISIHEQKLDELEDLIESANGQPVIVFYTFQHDRDMIRKRLDTHELKSDKDVEKWNHGEIPVLLAHPASIGHGLNLQYGGRIIIWFGLTWSLELYQQANDRLYRQGQDKTVLIHHIVAKNTVDERILKALKSKEKVQDILIEYMKEKVEEMENEKYIS